MSITIHDIAAMTGLDASTVSRALNGDPRVKEATRKRILETASKHGYVLNRSARTLITGKTSMICLAAGDIANEHAAAAAVSMNRYLSGRGYTLMILLHNNTDSRFRRCLADFAQKLCDAAVLYSPPSLSEDAPEYLALKKSKFPLLCLDQWFPNLPVPAISNDAEQSIGQLTDSLLEIGMDSALVHFPAPNTVAAFRKRSAEKRLREAGIPFVSEVDALPRLIRGHKSRRLGVFGDSPTCIPDLAGYFAEHAPEHCFGAMFDSWKFKKPDFFDRIFLCIQDTEAESEYAAKLLIDMIEGTAPVPKKPVLFAPKAVISPL